MSNPYGFAAVLTYSWPAYVGIFNSRIRNPYGFAAVFTYSWPAYAGFLKSSLHNPYGFDCVLTAPQHHPRTNFSHAVYTGNILASTVVRRPLLSELRGSAGCDLNVAIVGSLTFRNVSSCRHQLLATTSHSC